MSSKEMTRRRPRELVSYVFSVTFLHIHVWFFSFVFSTILGTDILFLSENPSWMMHKKKRLTSYDTWKYIRGFDVAEEKVEFCKMESVVVEEEFTQAKSKMIWFYFFIIPHRRKAAIHGIMMFVFQQFSGAIAMMYYLITIYEKAGVSAQDALYLSRIGGGSFFFSTIALGLLLGTLASIIIVGLNFSTSGLTTRIAVYTVEVVLYQLFWSSSLGPNPWVINSEIDQTCI
ncbi:MFS transporter, SP family, sugar:H+ symporter [Galdieria sulphuraria]|uniref:MFS transporter, SP family, sugar:H+ symporter n=1 Tax=Galdieria sulphuraria TaxID=130081 RepID=M2VXU7_GALSU|nr:MFS transporter, SP family, sugar:H+ symporter [Galdieria sulphuraria]EME28116.1 MFS transporter, SP family, sugar:H+ symporter [Galdieria sulphuraria]|eukprot:XP_005704636.1 MFS transporter, SP family, sugar:H+ symporter [Galdieria sulphuraria]